LKISDKLSSNRGTFFKDYTRWSWPLGGKFLQDSRGSEKRKNLRKRLPSWGDFNKLSTARTFAGESPPYNILTEDGFAGKPQNDQGRHGSAPVRTH